MLKNRSMKFQGICYILMAAFFFCLMSLFVRLAGDLPVMEKALFRNAVAALVAFIMLMRSKEKFSFGKGNLPTLLLRSGFGTAGIVANFYAIDHMAISDANMLNKLSPFFAIIMSWFILKEKASRKEWAAAGGQLSITAAYSKAPAKEISVFDYSQILFAALLGFLFLGELPDIYSLIGCFVIIGAAVWRMQAMREK